MATERVGVVELKKRCLPRICVGALSKEHVIFSKMLHRSKNQQRHDLSFQKMTGVSRKVKKYLATVNLQQKLRLLIKKLFRFGKPFHILLKYHSNFIVLEQCKCESSSGYVGDCGGVFQATIGVIHIHC
jgi:hypothetical protein